MNITKIKDTEQGSLYAKVYNAIEASRFIADMGTLQRVEGFKLTKVRVASKEYCGNHPKACEIGNPKHRKAQYLEGADWVEFNDMLNDTLDGAGASADIRSALVIVRKGTHRRITYDSNTKEGDGRNWVWDKDGPAEDFADYRGKEAPDSWFPEGTPGIYKAAYNVEG